MGLTAEQKLLTDLWYQWSWPRGNGDKESGAMGVMIDLEKYLRKNKLIGKDGLKKEKRC